MPELYILKRGDVPVSYAYGGKAEAAALWWGERRSKTPEEAKAAWEKDHAGEGETICQNHVP